MASEKGTARHGCLCLGLLGRRSDFVSFARSFHSFSELEGVTFQQTQGLDHLVQIRVRETHELLQLRVAFGGEDGLVAAQGERLTLADTLMVPTHGVLEHV